MGMNTNYLKEIGVKKINPKDDKYVEKIYFIQEIYCKLRSTEDYFKKLSSNKQRIEYLEYMSKKRYNIFGNELSFNDIKNTIIKYCEIVLVNNYKGKYKKDQKFVNSVYYKIVYLIGKITGDIHYLSNFKYYKNT
jgi:hypothetical protein